MSAVGSALQAAGRKASLARRLGPANPVMKRVRKFWAGIRSLKAELVAFPVRFRKTDSKLIVIADLPGLQKEEVKVDVTDSLLVIEVEPHRDEEPFFRRAGRRVIPLPDGARIHRAHALLKNGVLTVSLPLPGSHSGVSRRVSVEEAIDIEFPRSDHPQAERKPVSPVSDEKYAPL
ncbi:MAG: Hsp20/alpha crystallin family protein [Bryobacteraceae bacterium]|jgi:HSP20 family molecular chaperone IbpA